jgi:penicillin-insensitive murein endopeptidase
MGAGSDKWAFLYGVTDRHYEPGGAARRRASPPRRRPVILSCLPLPGRNLPDATDAMKNPSVLVLVAGCLLAGSAVPALAQNPWGEARSPSAGRAQAIGGYAAGCIAGAAELPLAGQGYQVMRPGRNRNYGHPRLVAYVKELARSVDARGMGRLLVGDLSQPRGGPATYGHASHQIGLDVDLWFRLLPRGSAPLTAAQTEQLPMDSVVRAADGAIDKKRWDPKFADLLQLVAQSPQVDRIFVNPIIKQHLCSGTRKGEWLAKLRPWWGHDSHFHVRLACPADSPLCQTQAPFPPGDGCDELERWVRDIREAKKRPPPKRGAKAPPELPLACEAVLVADAAEAEREAGVARVSRRPATDSHPSSL